MDTWRPRKMRRNKYQLLFNKVTSILFPIPETIKPRANGRNIVYLQLLTLLDVTSFVRLHTLLQVVGRCCVLLRKVWNRSNFSASNSQHLLLFRDRRSVAQQCWIRLHSSSNIAGATHAHYASFAKTYGLYPSHDALQVPTLSGVVASVCITLPTRTQQLSTLLAQQCWELLRPFQRSLREKGTSFRCKDFWDRMGGQALLMIG